MRSSGCCFSFEGWWEYFMLKWVSVVLIHRESSNVSRPQNVTSYEWVTTVRLIWNANRRTDGIVNIFFSAQEKALLSPIKLSQKHHIDYQEFANWSSFLKLFQYHKSVCCWHIYEVDGKKSIKVHFSDPFGDFVLRFFQTEYVLRIT